MKVAAAFVVASLALAGLPSRADQARDVEGADALEIRWLAAGDSYSSGEGLPDVSESSCQRADNQDGRSSAAFAEVAREQLEDASGFNGELSDRGRVRLASGTGARGGFNFVACTGAVTEDLFDDAAGKKEWDLEHNGRFDLATFSFGGNNVGFASILLKCLGISVEDAADSIIDAATMYSGGGHLDDWLGLGGCPPEDVLRGTIDGLASGGTQVDGRQLRPYEDFLRDVASRVMNPGGNVVVVGYPELIEDPQFWPSINRLVRTCQGIHRDDALMLRGVAGLLNQTIGSAVETVNREGPNGVQFTFVDINSGGGAIDRADSRLYEPSTGSRHALCASEPWLNGVLTTGVSGGDVDWDFSRSFHPTQYGHTATGGLVAETIRALDWSMLDQTPGPGSETEISTAVPLGNYVADIAASDDAAWLADDNGIESSAVVYRLDPEQDGVVAEIGDDPSEQMTTGIGGFDSSAVNADGVWATGFGRLFRIDPDSDRVVASIEVEPAYALADLEVAASSSDVWVVSDSGTVYEVEASTNSVREFAQVEGPGQMAATTNAVWVESNGHDLVRLDPESGDVVATVRASDDVADGISDVGANGEAAWVTNSDGTVWKIDAGTNDVDDVIELPDDQQVDDVSAGDIAVTETSVWLTATDFPQGRVVRIDTDTNEITVDLRVPRRPDDDGGPAMIAATDADVWVVDWAIRDSTVLHIVLDE